MTVIDVDAATDQGGAVAASTPVWTCHGDISLIAEPWVTALGELDEVARSRKVEAGPIRYSYAELADVLSHSRPVLARHDLAAFQVPQVVDGEVAVTTIVMHTSGTFLQFAPFTLPAGATAQSTGSAETYARRYSLTAILGLGTEDNDGATAGTRQSPPPAVLSADNVARFLYAAHDSLLTAEEIGAVVLEATQGRTIDPHNVYVTEVAALREALRVASDPVGEASQARPSPAVPGEVSQPPPPHEGGTSPDQPADTPDE